MGDCDKSEWRGGEEKGGEIQKKRRTFLKR